MRLDLKDKMDFDAMTMDGAVKVAGEYPMFIEPVAALGRVLLAVHPTHPEVQTMGVMMSRDEALALADLLRKVAKGE